MKLTPFYREGRHRFFFASPETGATHIERSCFLPDDYLFVINDWYIPDHPSGVQAYRRIVASGYRNLRIMCNTRTEQQILIEDFRFPPESTLFCPRHFFHGSKSFAAALARRAGTIRYDAVLNARSKPYKNRWAAAGVANLALIDFEAARPEIPCRYHNERHLTLEEVASVLQSSRVGLCLSFIEGASLASLEYLLCGLPVVSTHSLGGRDNWYTAENCILVGPGVEDGLANRFDHVQLREEVVEAVATWIERMEAGGVEARKIREEALTVNQRFTDDFLHEIGRIVGGDADPGRQRLVPALKPYPSYGVYAN